MNNEIKEILYLEKYIDKYKSDEKSILNGNRLTTPAMLDYLEVKALLDYITNLQEKYEEADNDRHKLFEQKEKAIEYIKGWQSFPHTNGSTHNELRNLLNILQGEDKE